MSGWEVGDIALCIKPIGEPSLVRAGASYKVIGLDFHDPRYFSFDADDPPSCYLGFSERVGYYFDCRSFLKVTPDADFVAEERNAEVPA